MTAASDAEYERAAQACLVECRRWHRANRDARLKFRALLLPSGAGGLISSLENALELGVAGNSVTRKLLTAMQRAVPGGSTVLMAEYAIEQVYGIPHALTRRAVSN